MEWHRPDPGEVICLRSHTWDSNKYVSLPTYFGLLARNASWNPDPSLGVAVVQEVGIKGDVATALCALTLSREVGC